MKCVTLCLPNHNIDLVIANDFKAIHDICQKIKTHTDMFMDHKVKVLSPTEQ